MRIRASQYVFAGIQSMTSATRAAATVSSMPAASAMWAMSPDALARSRPDGSGVGSESPERTSVSRSATLRAVSRPQIVPFRVPSTGSFSLVGEIPHRERGDLFIYLFVYGSVTGDRPEVQPSYPPWHPWTDRPRHHPLRRPRFRRTVSHGPWPGRD